MALAPKLLIEAFETFEKALVHSPGPEILEKSSHANEMITSHLATIDKAYSKLPIWRMLRPVTSFSNTPEFDIISELRQRLDQRDFGMVTDSRRGEIRTMRQMNLSHQAATTLRSFIRDLRKHMLQPGTNLDDMYKIPFQDISSSPHVKRIYIREHQHDLLSEIRSQVLQNFHVHDYSNYQLSPDFYPSIALLNHNLIRPNLVNSPRVVKSHPDYNLLYDFPDLYARDIKVNGKFNTGAVEGVFNQKWPRGLRPLHLEDLPGALLSVNDPLASVIGNRFKLKNANDILEKQMRILQKLKTRSEEKITRDFTDRMNSAANNARHRIIASSLIGTSLGAAAGGLGVPALQYVFNRQFSKNQGNTLPYVTPDKDDL